MHICIYKYVLYIYIVRVYSDDVRRLCIFNETKEDHVSHKIQTSTETKGTDTNQIPSKCHSLPIPTSVHIYSSILYTLVYSMYHTYVEIGQVERLANSAQGSPLLKRYCHRRRYCSTKRKCCAVAVVTSPFLLV